MTSVVASQRIASNASAPTRGPDSSTTPAWPSDAAASLASTKTVTWTGGGSSVVHTSTRAVALRQVEAPLVPSGLSGSRSALSVNTLSTSDPDRPSRPPQIFHHDSSREGCNTRKRSSADLRSSSVVIQTLRAASRHTPAMSKCSARPTSSEILDSASTRSNDTPPANASRSSGRSTVRRIVRTILRALSKPTSNRAATHSDRLRQPSPIAT